jgi:hypothetical protein
MLPPDYIKAVIADYQKKRAENLLPFDMKQLSPARFKAACLEVRRRGFDRRDERLLAAYFGEATDQKACLQAIANSKIDRFRPLINFLKQKTNMGTDDKNFKDRPCEAGKGYTANMLGQEACGGPHFATKIEINSPKITENERTGFSIDIESNKKTRKRKIMLLTLSILIVLSIVLYWTHPNNVRSVIGQQSCMFWADDHYQPTACNAKIENIQVVALDSEKVIHFRKITRQDTITLNALGHVWYVKYKGNIEFYSADGFHPIDPNLRLKHLTPYIIRKYINGENIMGEFGQ